MGKYLTYRPILSIIDVLLAVFLNYRRVPRNVNKCFHLEIALEDATLYFLYFVLDLNRMGQIYFSQNHENDSVQIKYWVQTLKKGENMFQLIQDFASLKSFKGENKFHKWLSNLNNCIERINH